MRPRLTQRGGVVLVASPALAVAARVTHVTELAMLGFTGAAVLLAAVIGTAFRGRRLATLRGHRHLRSTPHAGDDLVVGVSLTCVGPGRAPSATLADGLDGRRVFLRPAPLSPGQSADLTYAQGTRRRGPCRLEPLTAAVMDPFGLIFVTRKLEGDRHSLVYPHVEPIELGPSRPMPGRAGSPGPHATSLGHDEFFALHPYQLGDDLRRVHWRTTARVDELVVRHEEQRLALSTELVIDADPHPLFERVVAATASLAVALAAEGLTPRLRTLGGLQLAPEGQGLSAILEALSVIEARPGGRASSPQDRSAIVVSARGQQLPHAVLVDPSEDLPLQAAWDRAVVDAVTTPTAARWLR